MPDRRRSGRAPGESDPRRQAERLLELGAGTLSRWASAGSSPRAAETIELPAPASTSWSRPARGTPSTPGSPTAPGLDLSRFLEFGSVIGAWRRSEPRARRGADHAAELEAAAEVPALEQAVGEPGVEGVPRVDFVEPSGRGALPSMPHGAPGLGRAAEFGSVIGASGATRLGCTAGPQPPPEADAFL